MESPEIVEMHSLARWYSNRVDAAENPSIWGGRQRSARDSKGWLQRPKRNRYLHVVDKRRRQLRTNGWRRRHWPGAAGPHVQNQT
jgi:hypothetical protein